MISWTSSNGAPYTQVLLTKDCPIFMHAPADTDTIAIRARNVTLSLGTREAPVEILKGIDLDIARNESIAILGASGSGKSSLMAVLSGLERAGGGSVTVDGLDSGPIDEDALARAGPGRDGDVRPVSDTA